MSLWETEFDRSRESAKRLALLYLANDILQNSRKRGTQFVQPFYRVLPRTVRLTLKNGDAKVLHGSLSSCSCAPAGHCLTC